jgi:2-methylcitrate dehydratase PrpD
LLFGGRWRVPLPLAVLANTSVCEALDADDGYNPVKGHPGAFLFPAILAFAETGELTGSQALGSGLLSNKGSKLGNVSK